MKLFAVRCSFLIISCCIAVVLVAATGCANNQAGAVGTETQVSQSSIPLPPPMGLDDFVIYPQAEDIKLERSEASQELFMSFNVIANPVDIVEFYKKAMKDDGWLVRKEYDNEQARQFSAFMGGVELVWLDQQGTLPYFLLLGIDVTSKEESGITRSYVQATLRRVPNLDKLPLAPDAQQVEEKKEYVKSALGGDKVTEEAIYYFTNLSPQEVEDYYRDAMVQSGWWLVTSDSHDPFFSPEGLTFRFNVGGGDYSEATGKAVVVAKLEADGRTRVRIGVVGLQLRIRGN